MFIYDCSFCKFLINRYKRSLTFLNSWASSKELGVVFKEIIASILDRLLLSARTKFVSILRSVKNTPLFNSVGDRQQSQQSRVLLHRRGAPYRGRRSVVASECSLLIQLPSWSRNPCEDVMRPCGSMPIKIYLIGTEKKFDFVIVIYL